MKIVLLGGAGIIGKAIARDLAIFGGVDEIVIADLNAEGAKSVADAVSGYGTKVSGTGIDVTDRKALVRLIEGSGAVVNAVQYYFNLDVMRGCLDAGVNYLDLGGLFHTNRKQLELHEEFERAGITAILGMGSCPGVANVQTGLLGGMLDRVKSIKIYNGSTPDEEEGLSWAYSIETILDEMTKKPVVFRNGKFVEMEPASEEEFFMFPEPLGYAKTHLSLHSEIATIPLSLKDKGIEEAFFKITFFGYAESAFRKLQFLIEIGMADTEPVEVKGVKVRPRDVLVAVLRRSPETHKKPKSLGFKDIATVAEGRKDGKDVEWRVDTWAWPNEKLGISGGTLLVASPPAIVARWLAGAGPSMKPGVYPPEVAVDPLPFFQELEKRGAVTTITRKEPLES